MKNKFSGVYAIVNLINGKRYIGSSIDIKKRWYRHTSLLNRNISNHRLLQDDWNIYRKKQFALSILEEVSPLLSKQQYEKYETKWIIHFKSHLSEYGYNSTLPGNIKINDEGGNVRKVVVSHIEYVCINACSGETVSLIGAKEIERQLGIRFNKVSDLCLYWKGIGKNRTIKGWMIIKKEDYDPSFDYLSFRRARSLKYGRKLSSTEYYRMRRDIGNPIRRYVKKSPEEYIKREDRKLKRIPILAINILTGEERTFPMIKSCSPEFNLMKVRKCISHPFGKYKHRGHYFRKV